MADYTINYLQSQGAGIEAGEKWKEQFLLKISENDQKIDLFKNEHYRIHSYRPPPPTALAMLEVPAPFGAGRHGGAG